MKVISTFQKTKNEISWTSKMGWHVFVAHEFHHSLWFELRSFNGKNMSRIHFSSVHFTSRNLISQVDPSSLLGISTDLMDENLANSEVDRYIVEVKGWTPSCCRILSTQQTCGGKVDVKEHQQRSSADFIRWSNLVFTGSPVGTPPTVDGRNPAPPAMYKAL